MPNPELMQLVIDPSSVDHPAGQVASLILIKLSNRDRYPCCPIWTSPPEDLCH